MGMLLKWREPEPPKDEPVVKEVIEAKETPKEEPEQAKVGEKKKGGRPKKEA